MPVDRVWLAAYPRSGVTFLRHVLERMYGVPTFTRYENEGKAFAASNSPVSTKEWPKDAADVRPVHFVKTHYAGDAPHAKWRVIHLIRDGRDCAVSLAHYYRDIWCQNAEIDAPSFDDVVRHIALGSEPFDVNGRFGMWGHNVLTWLGRPDAAIIHFEDLIRDPVNTARNAIMELGLVLEETPDVEIRSFQDLHEKHPQFFREGGQETWRYKMNQNAVKAFEMRHGAALDALKRVKQRSMIEHG